MGLNGKWYRSSNQVVGHGTRAFLSTYTTGRVGFKFNHLLHLSIQLRLKILAFINPNETMYG